MKRAFLVGNQNYDVEEERLNSTRIDVVEMKRYLEIIGYKVIERYDLDFKGFRTFLDEISAQVQDEDEIIFYFSGHGFHFKDSNYLQPVDYSSLEKVASWNNVSDDFDESFKVINSKAVLNAMKKNINGCNLIILDACRSFINNPKLQIKDFDEISSENSNFIGLYATKMGEETEDGIKTTTSEFTEALLNTMVRVNQTIDEWYTSICNYLKDYGRIDEPVLNKNTGKNYVLIPDSIINLHIEKIWINELEENYKKSDDKNSVMYFSDEAKKMILSRIEVAKKSPFGFIDLLAKEDCINIVDIYEESIHIYTHHNAKIIIVNNKLYDFDKIKKHITCHGTKENYFTVYRNQNASYKFTDTIRKEYIMLKTSSKSRNIINLFNEQINLFGKYESSDTIEKYIGSTVSLEKNIIIAGAFDVKTDDYISSLINEITPYSKILIIQDDCKIHHESMEVKEILLKDIVGEPIEEYDYVVAHQYDYRSGEKNTYENLIDRSKRFILGIDIIPEMIQIYIDLYNNKEGISGYETYFNKADLIILMNKTKYAGDILDSIYKKTEEGIFEKVVEVKIDYKILDRINTHSQSKK